jgi:imidazole glycerol phosphate synthase glutamine amidotransferase subunit
MIAVLDYGGGNVGSVLKAVEYLGKPAEKVDQPATLAAAEKIIFPGQGHFGAMMKGLEERKLLAPLREALVSEKPFLGICLGLQALYESSEEAPGVAGLGILPCRVARFHGVFKVPHIGWSQIEFRSENKLFRGVPDGSFVYFCHSYYGPVMPEACAVTEYGQSFAAGVEKKNLWAVQFHPEKSGEVGLRVLSNFLNL